MQVAIKQLLKLVVCVLPLPLLLAPEAMAPVMLQLLLVQQPRQVQLAGTQQGTHQSSHHNRPHPWPHRRHCCCSRSLPLQVHHQRSCLSPSPLRRPPLHLQNWQRHRP